MMNDISISLKEAKLMKHTIGYDNRYVKGRINRTYKPYRNYFSTHNGATDFELLEGLCDKGLMLSRQDGSSDWLFHVSKQGKQYLGKLLDIKILEEDEDL